VSDGNELGGRVHVAPTKAESLASTIGGTGSSAFSAALRMPNWFNRQSCAPLANRAPGSPGVQLPVTSRKL